MSCVNPLPLFPNGGIHTNAHTVLESRMSVEEVVAKAKAIAAKLSGGGDPGTVTATTNEVNPSDIARAAEAALQFAAAASTLTSAGAASESGSVKRKRWGVTPDGDNDDATTATPEKRIKHEAQKRMWISTANKPASHYRLYWEMHGPAITRQVSSGEIALRLEGRGSSKIPALPGIPEQVSQKANPFERDVVDVSHIY